MGDDQSDEFMFRYLEERKSSPKTYTVTVGKKPSAAKHFLNDIDQVMEVLNALTKVSTTSNRNLSLNDLRLMDYHHNSNSHSRASSHHHEPSLAFQSGTPPTPLR
jgi:trehalose 6-phosphate synthase/phosphatase